MPWRACPTGSRQRSVATGPPLWPNSSRPRLYVVGRGPGLGVAAETALKLKETSGVLAEALSAAEIQHGPKAVIGPGFPILAYGLDDPGGQDSRAFATDLPRVGGQVMVASHAPAGRRSALASAAAAPSAARPDRGPPGLLSPGRGAGAQPRARPGPAAGPAQGDPDLLATPMRDCLSDG